MKDTDSSQSQAQDFLHSNKQKHLHLLFALAASFMHPNSLKSAFQEHLTFSGR